MDASSQAAGVDTNPEVLNAIVKASETYSIVASQDIVDVRGLKLWAKGQPVSQALQQRLLERKLQRPLEACLTAEDGVTPQSLSEDLSTFFDGTLPLAAALRPWASTLLEHLKKTPLHPVAQLLLTTTLATRPSTIPHAVHSMALAGAMARSAQSSMDIRLAMLGGLLHDIGEAYIQPLYLDHDDPLDVVGHKHLVVHPRVAQLLLSSTTDYPESLGRGIAEHHERMDGSGYPARLQGANISPLGRILAVVEVTMGILKSPRAPLTRASFALRVIPGEFDTTWTSPIFNIARTAKEELPEAMDWQYPTDGQPLQQIHQRMKQAQELGQMLKTNGRSGAHLAIVDLALQRLSRMHIAWNALGLWALPNSQPQKHEQFELEMAGRELRQRFRELQRQCMLLAERLGPLEQSQLEPLWEGLFEKPRTTSTT
jgi:HD domain